MYDNLRASAAGGSQNDFVACHLQRDESQP